MTALCLCVTVHQPYRLRPFSFFDVGRSTEYFDTALTQRTMERVASSVYLPIQQTLEKNVRRWNSRFQCALAISGTAIEQMQAYAPQALTGFRRLAGMSAVEILGGSYYHSLAGLLADPTEYLAQLALHREIMQRELGVVPRVVYDFASPYHDKYADSLQRLGYDGMLAGGEPGTTRYLAAHLMYRPTESVIEKLLRVTSEDDVVRVTVGCDACDMHAEAVSEVLTFIDRLAESVLGEQKGHFLMPTQMVQWRTHTRISVHESDEEPAEMQRCNDYWLGNLMQRRVFHELYHNPLVRRAPRDVVGRLQASDHLDAMRIEAITREASMGNDVACESPYDAFIRFMNVLRDIQHHVKVEGESAA